VQIKIVQKEQRDETPKKKKPLSSEDKTGTPKEKRASLEKKTPVEKKIPIEKSATENKVKKIKDAFSDSSAAPTLV
jgi:hypothetical protein